MGFGVTNECGVCLCILVLLLFMNESYFFSFLISLGEYFKYLL